MTAMPRFSFTDPLPAPKASGFCPRWCTGLLLGGLLTAGLGAQKPGQLWQFGGVSAGDEFGRSVSSAGDIDGDGFADVVIGAPYDDHNGSDSGSARVYSGATGALLHVFYGDSAGDEFGYSVSGAGDVDGDGFVDVVIGASHDDSIGNDSGSARVYSGASGVALYMFGGVSAGDGFGRSVSGVGDVDGDGFDDVVIGAHRDDNHGVDAGSAMVCTLPWSRASVYGAGCAGNSGIPALAPASVPALGAVYSLHATSFEATANAALLITGLSRTTSSQGPLPFDLQPFGLGAGCALLASVGATEWFTVSGGAGTYDLPVPNSHALAGLPLHHQAASIDAAVPGGFAMSNGVRGLVGL